MVVSAACERTEPDPVPNVRLGMSPRDVRERFHPGVEGSWQTSLGNGDDTLLDWSSKEAKGSLFRDARFEFHLGMLVAIRARAVAEGPAESVTTTAKTVTLRRPLPQTEGGGVSVVVLARDCPTHKDEAESLAQKAGPAKR